MLTKRIIPCLDIDKGRVVKGVNFSSLIDSGDPVEQAARYNDEGADELVILDISATNENRYTQIEVISKVRKVLKIPLTVGGGVSGIEDVERLLNAGADKVSVNSAAVNNPEIIAAMAERFGKQCTVVAIDAKRNIENTAWTVLTKGGRFDTKLDLINWLKTAEHHGAGEILLTSFDRDGSKKGYDLAMLSAVSTATELPVIASGGASCPEDMQEAFRSGASAVLAASIFHFQEYSIKEVKTVLANSGVAIRLC
ncbi:MAG: imidazole glycerol phosphate synthase subunit HisF [Proteobacteria bacterium]|nr:imidazole glycerol phosphate synthase subunit HisF [Pseudomonadota bacterium]